MIYDIITYNGERELFDIRYNILKDYVDGFRVIEFDQTFSGKPKPPLFNNDNLSVENRIDDKTIEFTPRWPKVRTYYLEEPVWSKYKELALSSPNTQYGKGAEHWIREFAQKESIKDCLTDLQEDDICIVGDCDEIWQPNIQFIEKPAKLKLKVYSYYLNNRSNEEFYGPLVSDYKTIRESCLNHLRANAPKTEEEYGWHFTSMGGADKVKQKLTDSYTKETYATDGVLDNLKDNIDNNRDFLGRNFEYRLDESEWPQYLKDNKEKYKHLLK